jgi:bloom syndrome protein
MEGRDVFVLIPTGGGKSLCFQLPAVCALGKTRGLTVVFSPLLALMHDQVKALKALNIDAECLSSETRSRTTVLNRLQMDDASKLPAPLYISPEYFQKNHTIQGILSELYGRSLLARFVVDEAHCLLDAYFRNFRAAVGNIYSSTMSPTLTIYSVS